jgi:hypothetical protein
MAEWHAIQVKPNAEGRVAIGLQGARLTGYLPLALTRRVVRGRDCGIAWAPLFRGSARQRRRLGLLVELAGLPFRVLAPADRLEKVA